MEKRKKQSKIDYRQNLRGAGNKRDSKRLSEAKHRVRNKGHVASATRLLKEGYMMGYNPIDQPTSTSRPSTNSRTKNH